MLAFFLTLLAVGLAVYKDYGLTWDDLAQIEIGELNFKYAFQGDPTLFALKNRYYGPLFEMFLYAVTRGLPDRQLFLPRHLLTFASVYAGVAALYFLAKKITGSWLAGLLASVLLVTTPFIFAHAFYNSKDIPFLTAFIVAAWTLMRSLDVPACRNTVLHALASAAVIALRAPGILIFGLTLGLFGLHFLLQPGTEGRRGWLVQGVFYALLTAGLALLFWPVLWHDPVGGFIQAMRQMGKFPWEGGTVLYRGQFVEAAALPWHYIPVWMLITIPLPYLALAAIGGIKAGFSFLFRPGSILAPDKRNFLILTAWLVIPILTVIVLRSVLYDGWRQMFFVYPPVVIFAALGVKALFSIRIPQIRPVWARGAAGVLLAAALFKPLLFMAQNHPHENVYFNRLGGEDMARVKRHYELDYWGLSYKQGLEYLLAYDDSETIPIYVFNRPGRINAQILPEEQRKRLAYMDKPEEATYFLTNYRWHPQPYDYSDEIYAIRVGNASIFSIFRLRP
ncbi:MAG: glycosyltransferase family 39 protein [Anaerolineaceae bacterium]|nr:glycosyltransferase family 39 protein [Anaerolineaceae bacterium]